MNQWPKTTHDLRLAGLARRRSRIDVAHLSCEECYACDWESSQYSIDYKASLVLTIPILL